MRATAAALPVLATLCGLAAGCGAGTTTTEINQLPPTFVVGTPTVVAAGALTVTIAGQPTRQFIIAGGRWKVCDKGTVTNGATAVAHDVRVTVTYIDHGIEVGQTTRADASQNGGALGDIAAGGSKDFTVCGIAHNEPDTDRVTAAAA